MSKILVPTHPIEINSGTLTFYEVRVLGAFIGSFCNRAVAAGVEADAIMNIIVKDISANKEFSDHDFQNEDRLFMGTWTDGNGKAWVLYAALVGDVLTSAFSSIDAVLDDVAATYKR